MGIYTYDLQNKKRDLTDVLSQVIAQSPKFIGGFGTVANAVQQKHEWLEDQITGRQATATSVSSGVVTLPATDASKFSVGTLFIIDGDSALFNVTAKTSTTITVSMVSANGSSTTAVTASDVLKIVSTPTEEGSSEGEATSHFVGTDYNAMQIFRKEIILTGSALALKTYGNFDNALDRQTAYAMEQLIRDLNRQALFGRRVDNASGVKGEAGGLYLFGCQTGGLSVAKTATPTLNSVIINDGAELIQSAGGTPNQILCSIGQARVLAHDMKDNIQIVREDNARGVYVANVVNEVTGGMMTITGDYDVPDTDVWVMDNSGFGLSNLDGRAIHDIDSTPNGYDGVRRTILGELTFEFKNAKQRLCRISGLKPSATALVSF